MQGPPSFYHCPTQNHMLSRCLGECLRQVCIHAYMCIRMIWWNFLLDSLWASISVHGLNLNPVCCIFELEPGMSFPRSWTENPFVFLSSLFKANVVVIHARIYLWLISYCSSCIFANFLCDSRGSFWRAKRLEALRLTFHVEGKFWQAQNFLKKLQCDNKENQLVV